LDLYEYLAVLGRRWLTVVVCIIIGIALAATYVKTATKDYTASVQLFVTTPSDAKDLSATFQGSEFIKDRVQSYANLATTESVTGPVAADLKLTTSPTELAKEITSSVPLNTVFVNISVTDTNKLVVADIANAVARQLIKVVGTVETPADGGADPVRVTVVQPASVPTSPSSPHKSISLVLGLLIGIALGISVAMFQEAGRRRMVSADPETGAGSTGGVHGRIHEPADTLVDN
jgi:polysaccharide biosynthesis transport protein